ncbi:MAG: tetratricopeptide repeat protein, partial [Ignavibacteriaceae bacterium]|nr:tetratricopeptide repeat protein [Ignavibacteriaceae bacterium]
KKEIKEDKLINFYKTAVVFFEKYKNKIFTYAGVLVVVATAVYFYVNQKAETNEKAGLELSRIMTIYDQGSYLEAIEGKQGTNIIGLKRVVEEFSGTENGETAKIYLANCYSFLGNYDEAFKYYDDYSGSIDYFKAVALSGQAGYYASEGNYEKAANLFLQASKISKINSQNPDYLLNAGINYLKVGEKEEAKILFNQIKEDYTTSLANKEVDKYLSLIY